MTLEKCYKLYSKAVNHEIDSSNLREFLFPAYVESPKYCMKTLLLIRGQKSIVDRRVLFMDSLKLIHPLFIKDDKLWMSYIKYIPLVGRWDDLLYSWLNTDSYIYRLDVGKYIRHVYFEDLREINRGRLPKTLLSKWMPSYVKSDTNKSKLSKLLTKTLGLSRESYMKDLKVLRSKVDSIIDIYSNKLIIDELLKINSEEDLLNTLNTYFSIEGEE